MSERLRLIVRGADAALSRTASLVAVIPLFVALVGGGLAIARSNGFLGGLCAGLVCGIVFAVLFVGTANRTMGGIARGYRFTRAEYYLTVDLTRRCVTENRLTFRIRAVRPHIAVIENRYHWTGTDDDEQQRLPQILSGAKAVLGPVSRDHWTYYYIHLGPALSVGEERTVQLEQTLIDRAGTFQPHFTKTVLETIDELVLRVTFVGTPAIPPVRASTGYPLPADSRDITDRLTRDEEGRYVELGARCPRPNRRYAIEWEWSAAEPPGAAPLMVGSATPASDLDGQAPQAAV